MCFETESNDALLLSLVDLGQLLRKLPLGDIRTRRVQDVDNELATGEQPVSDKLARADSHWCVGLHEKGREDSQ